MLEFVDELASTEGKAVSLYFSQGTTQDRVESLLTEVFRENAIPPGVAREWE
jgi:hypothetical protein